MTTVKTPIIHRSLALLAVLALGACTTTRDGGKEDLGDAVTQPLRDLSIVRVEPEAVLEKARENPYLAPASQLCAGAEAEIAQLNKALGPDVDDPAIEEGQGLGGELVSGAIAGLIPDLPFRGVVRRVTGAHARDREVRLAVMSGMARRSYLKGMRMASGCIEPAPAAPEVSATP